MSLPNVLSKQLRWQHPLILDGGMATELERTGHDLNHPLWSAKMLLENENAVTVVHNSFLRAGANIVTTVGYQATFQQLEAMGHSKEEASKILLQAVNCACNSRNYYLVAIHKAGVHPLVAASIGPYGAFLADGSEYRGDYGISKPRLRHFHEERFQLLDNSKADLLACETIPSFPEAEVLAKLAGESPTPKTWLSFSCPDGQRISDGTPFAESARLVEESPGVVALGVNCTAPQFVASLISEARQAGLTKPLIVYPNSGEKYDPIRKNWSGKADVDRFADMAEEWLALGADVIGGCCRVRTEHIQELRKRLVKTG